MKLDQIEGKPDDKVAWGSDIAAQMLRRFGIPFISLNPGASYRGFHDSLVNHLGNENPGIILCLHEDHSVAIAHGYAKATGEPMACVLHSNVGLLHGMMGLFNAWCDRVPMIVLGRDRPGRLREAPPVDRLDPHLARPGRLYPLASSNGTTSRPRPHALVESMTRANMHDAFGADRAGLHRSRRRLPGVALDKEPEWPDVKRFQPPKPPRPGKETLDEIVSILSNAKKPIILFGRGSRQDEILAAAHPARRAARRLRVHRPQAGRDVPDRSLRTTTREPFNAIAKDGARADVRGRRHPGARLDGSRRRAASGQERRRR